MEKLLPKGKFSGLLENFIEKVSYYLEGETPEEIDDDCPHNFKGIIRVRPIEAFIGVGSRKKLTLMSL